MTLYDSRYEYVKDLGEGGFGKVFLAKEKVSNRLVAIKQLKNTDKLKQEDIIHEIEIVSKFENQNIVAYYHHFWQGEQLFLVMEYCAGGSLRDKMKDNNLVATEIFKWIKILAECLRVVHKKGIIHHDIKPDNILFSENGTIKISDFGIANTGGGTRAYMSPEALNWDSRSKSDPRVDIYAIGVTLIELLTGKNPFFFLSKEQIHELHQKADFPINHLPNWQQEIILKAINKTPELRFQYMVELEEAINAKAVPVIFKKEILKAAELVEYAEKALRTKKWRNAAKYLEHANKTYPR
jgi:serine/threonine protein kinase